MKKFILIFIAYLSLIFMWSAKQFGHPESRLTLEINIVLTSITLRPSRNSIS